MTSAVSICNRALLRLRVTRIADLSEQSEPARLCSALYPAARRRLIESHPWNFAVRRTSLARLSTAPAWGFADAFALPADFLRLLDINDRTAADTAHSLETVGGTRALLIDAGAVDARYLFDQVDPGQFPDSFQEALSLEIARKLSYGLTDVQGIGEALTREFQAVIRGAKGTDAMQGTPRVRDRSAWLAARV